MKTSRNPGHNWDLTGHCHLGQGGEYGNRSDSQAQAATHCNCEPEPSAPLIGSAWDVSGAESPEARARHLAEWIEGSGVHPDLAAANVQTLQGSAVIEALAGDRLESLGGWATQYATAAVGRLLRALEPIAEAGGWWCSGLDPLRDWAPMEWGTFRPDRPRWDRERNRARKYESPLGAPTRSIWLRVPATVAALVARRWAMGLPADVAADVDGSRGAFWRWWSGELGLPLLIVEGAKKAGAALTAGYPAVALPGIDSGAKRTGPVDPGTGRRSGPLELLADLAGAALRDRACWVVFDHSEKVDPREPIAARRLGRLLAAAGAADVRTGTLPGPEKGLDDALLAGRCLRELVEALAPLGPDPVLPRLRRPDRVAPAGRWIGEACPIPAATTARVVALASGLGTGKTEAVAAAVAPHLYAGRRVVLISHRRSLGAALAERLGVPWADEAAPGSDLRQTGIALCVDSLCSASRLRFVAGEWAGAVVVIDEAAQVLHHALTGRATAIADRRPAVLRELGALLAGAHQVLIADGQLSAPVLEAIEDAAGARALLIGSETRPAAGRRLVVHPNRDSWRGELVGLLRDRRRLWVATTAKEAGSPNSAQALAQLAADHWPGCRVLVVDSATVADETHDAHRLAGNPDGIAAAYDAVICTPAVQSGLSVRVAFDAVMVLAGGTTPPAGVVQAMARVRGDCVRHLYAPARSPGGRLTIGSGALDPAGVVAALDRHCSAVVGQLVAAGGWSVSTGETGPWLRLWAQLVAQQNREALAYGATVAALAEREGYRIEAADRGGEALGETAGERLKGIAAAQLAAEDRAVIEAEPLTDQEAQELQRRRRLDPAQRAQLQRWRIDRAWGLGGAAPSPQVIEAHREGRGRALRLRWLVSDPEARRLAATHDEAMARRLAPTGEAWAPDLAGRMLGGTLAAAEALGVAQWLDRAEWGDWFGSDDAQLVALHATVTACRGDVRQALGVGAAERPTTTLRRLLAAVGARLETERCKGRRDGNRDRYRYRVVLDPLPAGVDGERLRQAWADALCHPETVG